MKQAYYFSHDTNAHSDPKIMAMRNVYGSEGYGWYWVIVELLAEQDGYKLQLKPWLYDAIAMAMLCDANTAAQFVTDCIEKFELFQSDGECFWSNSLCRRMEKRKQIIEKRSAAGKIGAAARWGNVNRIANVSQTHSKTIAKHSKGKESKDINKDINNNICAEQDKPAPAPPPVITLPLNDKTEYPVTQSQVDEWKELYPAVDVMQQLRNMKGWLDANRSRRKTKAGILRFINGWLAKEQDRGRASPPQRVGAKPIHFEHPVEDYDRLAVDLFADDG